ncbi:hypothetical protein FRC00_011978 [Tulasnella sp. 408]|nr:hypothetical protein FRC00_011978 [Tulasnella sp. 408]
MPGDAVPFPKEIEISNEAFETIRAIDLTQVPMNWRRTLEHVRGLRTLALNGVYDDAITHEQIFNVLVASPGLESLTIGDMRIGDSPFSLSSPTESISLPQLRSITLMTDGRLTNNLLRRIRPPPDVTELDIRPTHFPSNVATTFWYETMGPWFPVGVCRLETYSDYCVFIEFQGLSMAAALRWIHDVIGPVDDGPGRLQISVHGPAFEDHDVLEILPTFPGLTGILVQPVDDLILPSLDALFQVLGQAITDPAGTPDPKPTFPTLRKLVLNDWGRELDSIIDMLRRRYSMRSIYRQQVPDLSLDLSSLQFWLQWRQGVIISFSDGRALRELDGVREVRMGCAMQHLGNLAVIWDEEQSIPAWG